MASWDLIAEPRNMVCAVCRDVYTSPRFLPCHHSFCLHCLEQLEQIHGNVIPCPTYRAFAFLPHGGVAELQVNFYFTDEELERARNVGSPNMCAVHADQKVIFHCTLCDKTICMRCKMTKHEGHATEDLSEATARCRETIQNKLCDLALYIESRIQESEMCKQTLKVARDKRDEVFEQIYDRYDAIVVMAAEHRDEALKELQEISESLEKDLAADTQRVQGALDSLLQLQGRALQALSTTACDTEVLQAEKDMRQDHGITDPLRKLEGDLFLDTTSLSGHHGDFTNDIDDEIKRYIRLPIKLTFPSLEANVVPEGKCDDGECHEVLSLRQEETKYIGVFYGGIIVLLLLYYMLYYSAFQK